MLNDSHNPSNTVLQFSGGKDSLAMLFLMQPHWDQLTVLWVNTGAAYPETIALMDRVRALVPHFHELKTDQPASIERNGYPVDVVPIRHTNFGHGVEGGTRIKIRPYFQCCGENIWEPLQAFCKFSGVATVIRGQRNDERMTGQLRDGDERDGIVYLMPLQNWTEEDVFKFLRSNDIPIPDHYSMTGTSLDCMGCTAFLHEIGVHQWLKAKYPEKHAESQAKLHQINQAIESEMVYLRAVLEL